MRTEAKFLNPTWKSLQELLSSAQNSVFISSPWISKEGNKFLRSAFQRLLQKGIHTIELWTRFDPVDYVFETSDHLGLLSTLKLCTGLFSKLDLQIWTHPRLHAKVYVVDNARAMVTSSNLTQGGFVGNIEAAMLIVGEAKIAGLFKLLRSAQKQMTRVSLGEVEDFVKSLRKIDAAKEDARRTMALLVNGKIAPLGRRKQKAPPYVSLRG